MSSTLSVPKADPLLFRISLLENHQQHYNAAGNAIVADVVIKSLMEVLQVKLSATTTPKTTARIH